MNLVECFSESVVVLDAENEIKRIMGAWYRKHRTDARLWPQSLSEWVEKHKPAGGTVTQLDLLTWMSEQSGLQRLLEKDVIKSYSRLERWADGRDFSGSYDNYFIYTATQVTGFLTFPVGGKRVVDGIIIARVLAGELDPFEGRSRD